MQSSSRPPSGADDRPEPSLKSLAVTLNALVLLAILANVLFMAASAPPGYLSIKLVTLQVIVALPFLTSLAAFRRTASWFLIGCALALNIAGVVCCAALGAVAALNIGGGVGLLLIFGPAFLLGCLNMVALIRPFRSKWSRPSARLAG